MNSSQGKDPKARKKPGFEKAKVFALTPTYPCSMGKVHGILSQWLCDGHIELPRVKFLHVDEENTNPKFCSSIGPWVTLWIAIL